MFAMPADLHPWRWLLEEFANANTVKCRISGVGNEPNRAVKVQATRLDDSTLTCTTAGVFVKDYGPEATFTVEITVDDGKCAHSPLGITPSMDTRVSHPCPPSLLILILLDSLAFAYAGIGPHCTPMPPRSPFRASHTRLAPRRRHNHPHRRPRLPRLRVRPLDLSDRRVPLDHPRSRRPRVLALEVPRCLPRRLLRRERVKDVRPPRGRSKWATLLIARRKSQKD